MKRATAAKGFSLLEVLVALAVLGAVLAAVYGMFSSGLRGLSRSDDRLTLALFAESLLERAELDLAAAGPVVEGTTPDGVMWRVSRLPYDPERLRQDLFVEEAPEALPRFEGPRLPGEEDEAEDAAEPFGPEEDGERGETAARGGSELGEADDEAGTAGAATAVKLRAWLLTAEVANLRGQSFALSRLAVEPAPP